ncbi:uncharacterized protein LOC113367737 [Ctenocephalides felis]|uniref:uncharacterized protein LOC113367737 n=1 Tax=Ctenocephalides felis TaxID=7515 RepID=UPI000E6E15D0|nr:uncharacterized protein LOC113367737 [Ctenocephalides felis]
MEVMGNSPNHNRMGKYLTFPPGDKITTPQFAFFVAIALPLANRQDIFLSYNYEFNYDLPENHTEIWEDVPTTWAIEDPPDHQDFLERRRRSLNRTTAYHTIQKHFEHVGLEGKHCLLRTICEAAEMPLHHNGLIGDLFHIFLLPSTSKDEGLPKSYAEAEAAGNKGDCNFYKNKCDFGLLDLVSQVF